MKTNKKFISFQIKEADYQKLKKEAQKLEISLSEFVRSRALMDQPRLLAMQAENKKLKDEKLKLEILSGVTIPSDEFKDITMRFDADQLELMIRIWLGFKLNKYESPLAMSPKIYETLKHSINAAIRESLIEEAEEKLPDDDFEDEIVDAYGDFRN